jgi:bifunctional non-homologous end joining protein LigD
LIETGRETIGELTCLRGSLHKSARARWIPPMLATLTDEPFSRQGWVFEAKLDGERCLAVRNGAEIRLVSRNQKMLNEKYPELVKAFHAQKQRQFAVDGEIVTFKGAVTSFSKLQSRMQVQHPSEELRRRVPVWFYAFDLLNLDGHDTRDLPLRERKALLKQALSFRDALRFSEHRETEGEPYFREACRKGWEGIIAKNGDAPYISRRSRDWLKFKCVNEQEFVIGGYTDPAGTRIWFGALLVGYYEGDQLVYAGKVGTGYNTTTLRRLGDQLRKLEIKSSPFREDFLPTRGVHWVKPKLIAQLGFSEWTTDGKLRHPRFLGLRSDKPPQEVVRENKVA